MVKTEYAIIPAMIMRKQVRVPEYAVANRNNPVSI